MFLFWMCMCLKCFVFFSFLPFSFTVLFVQIYEALLYGCYTFPCMFFFLSDLLFSVWFVFRIWKTQQLGLQMFLNFKCNEESMLSNTFQIGKDRIATSVLSLKIIKSIRSWPCCLQTTMKTRIVEYESKLASSNVAS